MKAYALVVITGKDEDCFDGKNGENLVGFYTTKKLAEKKRLKKCQKILAKSGKKALIIL